MKVTHSSKAATLPATNATKRATWLQGHTAWEVAGGQSGEMP
jgi:hypothetical protein